MADVIRGCQHTDCMYRQKLDGSCEYWLVEGTTRTFLHKDENVDINNPCQEYRPGEIARKFTLRVKY